MQYRNRDYLRLLNGKNAPTVERHIMAIFAVHGWPQQIVADNMPFNSEHFRTFCEKHSIKITTASPTYSQSNGQVERYVGIIKSLLRKTHENGQDESIALQEYRNTPITGCEYSPV
ncbi:YRD6-like protein [Mya arenaria]|nr:YRD6-like protein [Mya arenaria]